MKYDVRYKIPLQGRHLLYDGLPRSRPPIFLSPHHSHQLSHGGDFVFLSSALFLELGEINMTCKVWEANSRLENSYRVIEAPTVKWTEVAVAGTQQKAQVENPKMRNGSLILCDAPFKFVLEGIQFNFVR